MIYGYVRVSTSGQNAERQVQKMRELGIPDENMYIDHASGKNLDRPMWKRLMQTVVAGDQIIIDSLDRLGRDYDDVTSEWRRLTRVWNVDIRALDLEFMDSRSFKQLGQIGKLMEDNILSLLAYVAQTEREKMRQRQAEGIAIAKENGVYDYMKSKDYDEGKAPLVMAKLNAGLITAKDAAAELRISRSTLYRKMRSGELTRW